MIGTSVRAGKPLGMVLGLAVLACGALLTTASTSSGTTTGGAAAGSIVGTEFVLTNDGGERCARLGMKEGQPVLQFFSQPNNHCQLELGLQLFGAPKVVLRDTYSAAWEQGAALSIENEGDPGQMCIQMKLAAQGSAPPGVLRLQLTRSGEPVLEFTGADGKRKRASFADAK